MNAPRLEITRWHRGGVVIVDPASMLGLRWHLDGRDVHELIRQLSQDQIRRLPSCSGTVDTAEGRMTFTWKLDDVDRAIQELRQHGAPTLGQRMDPR